MLQWRVCSCVHVLLLHTMLVLEVPSCPMDMYRVMLCILLTTLYATLYITMYITLYMTLYNTLYTLYLRYITLYITLYVTLYNTLYTKIYIISGVTMNIIITESSSTHHPPRSNGDHSTWSEPKRRHLEEGVYWTSVCVL